MVLDVRDMWPHEDHPVCVRCGAFSESQKGDAFAGSFEDPREEVRPEWPRILVVLPGFAGDFLDTPGGDTIFSLLNCMEGVTWNVTGTFRCGRPYGARGKVDPEFQRNCSMTWLTADIMRLKPDAIVLMGLDAVKAAMGSAAPRSLSKVYQSTLRVEGLGVDSAPFLIGQSPWAHRPHEGANLYDTWVELFTRAAKAALKIEASLDFPYQEISDLRQSLEALRSNPARVRTFDVEVDAHELDAPRRTYWHDGAELLCVAASWVDGSRRPAYTFTPPACRRPEFWDHLFGGGAIPEGHFVKYDIQAAWALVKYNIYARCARLPTGEANIRDTAAAIHLGNQAISGVGLLPLAMKHLGVPNWKDETKDAIELANMELKDAWAAYNQVLNHQSRRDIYESRAVKGDARAISWLKNVKNHPKELPPKPTQPPNTMGFKAAIPRLYLRCARDTFLTSKLGTDIVPLNVVREKAPGPVAWRGFLRAMELTCMIERAGLPVDPVRLVAAQRVFREQTLAGKKLLLSFPEMQQAVEASPEMEGELGRYESPTPQDVFNCALEVLNPQSGPFRLRLAKILGEDIESFPKTKGKDGKEGNPSMDKYVISRLAGGSAPFDLLTYRQKIWRQFAQTKSINDLEAKLNTFRWLDSRSRIHTNYKIIKSEGGTDTSEEGGGSTRGTACVAKGTFIEGPRDLKALPYGTPIEDVKVGDLVYSYDDKGSFSVRKVLWSGQTGVKPTVRVCWRGDSTSKNSGDIYLTPEHRVRRIDGSWCRAEDLKPGDRIMSITRGIGSGGYPRLGVKGGFKLREHVFVMQQLGNDTKNMHVHHKNGPLDNRPGSLEVLTPAEHRKRHPLTEDQKKARGEILQDPEVRKKQIASIRSGIKVDRFTLLRRLASCQGGPKKVSVRYGLDYSTVVRQCKDLEVDFKAVSSRYGGDGRFVSRGRIREALTRDYQCVNDIQKVLRLGYYPIKKLSKYYGLNGFNHVVTSVAPGPVLPVYNLTVEGTHSFIGNQLSLANSSNPNLQNLKKDPAFRALFVARPGKCFIEADYDQGEPRVLAFVAGCPGWKEIFQRQLDIYQVTANAVHHMGVDMRLPDELLRDELERVIPRKDDMRNGMKTRLLAVMYMESARSFSKKAGIPLEEAEDFYEKLFTAYPEIKRYQNTQWETMMRGIPTINPFGRQELHPMPDERDREYRMKVAKIHRSRANFCIQTCLNDIVMWLGWELLKRLENLEWFFPEFPMDSPAALVASIHDALYGEVDLVLGSAYAALIVKTMSDISLLPFKYDVPMSVSLKVGSDLSKMVEVNLVDGILQPVKESERKYLPAGLI